MAVGDHHAGCEGRSNASKEPVNVVRPVEIAHVHGVRFKTESVSAKPRHSLAFRLERRPTEA
jgi:hypothetical protein